ncbi:transcription factor bHLH155-like isoform X1 [Punica granatum]|uniref:Transcription factor bHLH155-like isoform X1 n=1 Tax=Punica granatum TaxID=22663 RepID=A0A6P8C662_PUNGR|nr:transcription factor bHLH155-like isoform X1 [Punica granatum]
MEATALRQFLTGLCNNSCWDYAVFWKLWHQIPAVLSWEDGYYDQPKLRTTIEKSSGMLYFDGYSEFIDDETSQIYGTAVQYPIELLIADMPTQQYTLGEGLVGQVASTYNYCWISLEASQFKNKHFDFPEEWLPHVLAGVKTMLLVSVHPHGVLQLGSSHEVAENAAVVNHIKETFIMHQVLSGFATPPILKEDDPLCSLQSLADIDDPSIITRALVNELHQESPEDSEETNASNTSIFGSLQEIFEDLEENRELIHSEIGLSRVLVPLNEPLELSQQEMAQNEQLTFSYVGADLSGFPCGVGDSYVTSNIIRGPYGDDEEDVEYTRCKNLGIFSIPEDCDPFEALGNSFRSQTGEFVGTEARPVEIRDFPDGMESPPRELARSDAKVKAEDLLEAVIADLRDGLDGTSPISSAVTLTSSAAPVVQCDPNPSSKSLNKSAEIFMGESDNSVIWSDIGTAFANRTGNNSSKHSNPASTKSTVSSLTVQGQPRESQKRQLSGSKRKGRSGDSQKPRPRDRQLIQDRVKELRELVPDGSKCSIDALLDRTVKHMLFLRSVTNQAEKLRICVPPKENKPKIWKSLGIDEEDRENRRGWAFEFGGEFQVFPIVVEDVEHPGQMLIEMMCDEQGQFLEIAQVLRRLELTILKGVMETRSDNTWARFIVEASKGFQRMEIFWPLMQVLQQQRGKPITGIV